MNIGYVLWDYPVANETWIPLEIEELIMRGHNVKVHRKQYPYVDLRDCDFILSHFTGTAITSCRIGKPFGFVTHDLGIWEDDEQSFLDLANDKDCKIVGYISESDKEKYIEWGVDESKLVYWGECIDIVRIKRTRTMCSKIVCGGELTEGRGLESVLKAVPEVTVFGDGKLAPKLKALSDKAEFVGWLSRDELKDLFERSWLYIAPSKTEGVSLLILEALCMGLQVITTEKKDLEEYKDRVHFVKPNAIDSIKRLVATLPHTFELSARNKIAIQRSPKVIVDNLENKILEILK